MAKRRVVRPGTRQKPPAKSQWKLWTVAGAVAAVLVAGIAYYALWYQPVVARAGQMAPDFTLRLLNGESVTLSSLRGKPVLLSFWHST